MKISHVIYTMNQTNKDQKLEFFIIMLWSNKIRQLYKEPCKCGVDKVFFTDFTSDGSYMGFTNLFFPWNI